MTKFELGHLTSTTGVAGKMLGDVAFSKWVNACLRRHINADWGDCDEEDKAVNDEALKTGERLMSVYKHETLPTIWIITERDRSATTVLFPEEY